MKDNNNNKIGRPRLDPEQEDPFENYTVRLSFKTVRRLRKFGGGNFSQGLRDALDLAAQYIDAILKERNDKT